MIYSVYETAGLFLIYSFLGWCTEVIFQALKRGIVVNRGFLNGPICPIYGVGMVGVLLLLGPLTDQPFLLFLGGMVLCTLIELIGGWILKKIFDTRWWDYSNEPFNLGGYICLRFSILWGLAVTFVVKLVHPPILELTDMTEGIAGYIAVSVLYVLFTVDLIVTIVSIAGIKRRIRELEKISDTLHTVSDSISERLGTTAITADAKFDAAKAAGQEKLAKGKEKASEAKEKMVTAVNDRQEYLAQGREKLSASLARQQTKTAEGLQQMELRLTGTLEELQLQRAKLERQRHKLATEIRNRFSVKRLTNAFPDLKTSVRWADYHGQAERADCQNERSSRETTDA